MKKKFDAVVIGGGVGGMCAAALLAHGGKHVLLAEKHRYLGGRFSTVDHHGYKCATGGLAVPIGRDMEQVCDTVGIPSGVKPSTRVGMWLDGVMYDLSDGATRTIIRKVAKDQEESQRVIAALNGAMTQTLPETNMSFRDWLTQYTDNPRIHGIFQATISSLLTVNSHELSAAQYFHFIKVISPLTFGFIEGGSIALWHRMAESIRDSGGEVWTSTQATRIHAEDGKVTGVSLQQQNELIEVQAPVVVSNMGPAATVSLIAEGHLELDYIEQINRNMTPTAIMWLHFSSEELLMDYSAISVGCSRRVNMIDVPSLEAEGVAPPGKHLYTVGAAPANSLTPGDIKKEFIEVMKDLNDIFPEFDRRCEILTKTCFRGKWPGFRTVPENHVGHQTPIKNLYNVGDAACPSGYDGSMGAAHSARLVSDELSK